MCVFVNMTIFADGIVHKMGGYVCQTIAGHSGLLVSTKLVDNMCHLLPTTGTTTEP